MKITHFILLLTCITSLKAQDIKIGLFSDKEINSFTISIQEGRYKLMAKGEVYGEYKRGIFYITRHGDKLDVMDKRNFIGDFTEISLQPTTNDAIVTITPMNPTMKGRVYNDNIIVRVENGELQIINKVDMERYIAGVIEAECGPKASLEFYKAQAVLIRTYAIKNMYKHGEQGHNLCDLVHCQVFKGKSALNDQIYLATKATAGQVLMDTDSVLVLSPFHSNCGGRTSNAGMVWQKDLPYLQSIHDPFCNNGKKFAWSATISKNSWEVFLREKGVPEAIIQKTRYSYTATERKKYLTIGTTPIPFREIRERFILNSTYFAITDTGNQIIFNGKGYGHGIGMCQEGAMEMARVGYEYRDIIHFYFQNVRITDYREMEIDRY